MATALTWTVDYSGTASPEDVLAAKKAIRDENARRAAMTPPGSPLASGTNAEIKASTKTIMAQEVTASWNDKIFKAQNDDSRFTDAEKLQIKTNLNTRLDAGVETKAQIITDTAG